MMPLPEMTLAKYSKHVPSPTSHGPIVKYPERIVIRKVNKYFLEIIVF